jgi:hypothetical protein
MKIKTSAIIPKSPEQLWPLLTHSQMTASGCFCPGIPRPVACELPSQQGGVGAERRCVSDMGTIHQTITVWEPPTLLQFRMNSTDQYWGPCVNSIEENFELKAIDNGTRITRTTQISAKRPLSFFKEALFCIGLKRVHFYVFKNWRMS